MADMHIGQSPVAQRLYKLADEIAKDFEVNILARSGAVKKLRAAAEEAQHRLEVWLGTVDDRLSDWENEAKHEAQRVAFAAYRSALDTGHALLNEFKRVGRTGSSPQGS